MYLILSTLLNCFFLLLFSLKVSLLLIDCKELVRNIILHFGKVCSPCHTNPFLVEINSYDSECNVWGLLDRFGDLDELGWTPTTSLYCAVMKKRIEAVCVFGSRFSSGAWTDMFQLWKIQD